MEYEVLNNETGELIKIKSEDIAKKEYQDRKTKYEVLKAKFEKDPESLTFEELVFLRKYLKLGKDVKIDYKKYGFVISRTNYDYSNLDLRTVGVIKILESYVTHDGILVYKNKKPIKSIKDLRNLFNISKYVWESIVWREIRENGIIKKIKIENSVYLLANPLYFTKSRTITEFPFIAFYKELKKELNPVDYYFLLKKIDINPE